MLKKKLFGLALLLGAIMLMVALAGCGDSGSGDPSSPGGGNGGNGGNGGDSGISITWTGVAYTTSSSLDGVFFGGPAGSQKFYIWDENKVMSSVDGKTWSTPVNVWASSDYSILDITWGGGKFVAVGTRGMSSYNMAYSDDGVTWNTGFTWTGTPFAGGSDGDIKAITYGNGSFVAFQNISPAVYTDPWKSRIAYSANGTAWTALDDLEMTNSSAGLYNICWGAGKFVGVGDKGQVFYSADNKTPWAISDWTSKNSVASNSGKLLGIAYGSSKFVAVGQNGRAAYSSDADTWTAATSGLTVSLQDIAFGGGKFVAVGEEGRMTYSTDGITWKSATATDSTFAGSLGDKYIQGVAYGNKKFVAVGRQWIAYSNDQE